MIIENVCEIHGNGVYEFRLSKEVIEDIKNDIAIDINDIEYVTFLFENKKDKYVVYKKTFIENKLQSNYHINKEFYDSEEVSHFWENYMTRHCLRCVRDYENRHNITLTRNIEDPYPMF